MSNDLKARVAAAAEALESEGIRPTIQKVRELVQANNNDVASAFKTWQQAKSEQAKRTVPALDDLPVPQAMRIALKAVIAAHEQIMAEELEAERLTARMHRQSMSEKLERERTAARNAEAEASSDAQIRIAEAEARADAQDKKNAELTRELEEMQSQLLEAKKRYGIAEERTKAVEKRMDDAEGRLTDERVARLDAERRYAEAIESSARARADADARVRVVQLEAERRIAEEHARYSRAEARNLHAASRKPVPASRRR
ncbi:DNA-binding protein [Amaricoccus macauensis]|uniref:DNA-binding protein n=1 Tax=Amaricoccus macauensis TaxID=57001 RepID=UPI003C7E28D5